MSEHGKGEDARLMILSLENMYFSLQVMAGIVVLALTGMLQIAVRSM